MTNILFLCPHSAAKSVLAAAYCQQLAKGRGLELRADFAGTHPDEKIAPVVAEFLEQQGIAVPHAPKRVTRDDIVSASKIVSLGCEVSELPVQAEVVEDWHDVPPVSQGLQVSWQAIQEKVAELLERLEREGMDKK